jgi:DNA-binding transcriptional MerR regulator
MNDETTPEASLSESIERLATPETGMEPVSEPPEHVTEERVAYRNFGGGTSYVGLHEAMRLTGASKSTITRYSTKGKLSFETTEDGRRTYQVVELERVFGKLKAPQPLRNSSQDVHENGLQLEGEGLEPDLEVALLQAEVRRLTEINELLAQNAQEAKQTAAQWQQQAERATLMLTHRPEETPTAEPSKGFWKRIFGS